MKTQLMRDNIQVYLYKNTKDNDLHEGQLVCYQNQQGIYAHLGTIEYISIVDGFKQYQINGAMGQYLASELKLTNKTI